MNEPVYVWQHNNIINLIKVRSSLDQYFTGKRGTSNNGWEMVASNLRCGASAHQCKKKWENLQTKYKKIMDPPTGEGLEERPHGAHDWPYFDLMNKFMSDRHVMKPLLLIESSQPVPEASRKTSARSKTFIKSNMPAKSNSFSTFCTPEPSTSYSSQPSTSYSSQPSISYSSQQSPSCSSQPHSPYHSQPPTSFSPQFSSFSGLVHQNNFQMSGNSKATPRKRRRTPSANKDGIKDLVTIITEDIGKQEREREQARKVEQDLIEVLREFLSK